jgi:hypothetical protein
MHARKTWQFFFTGSILLLICAFCIQSCYKEEFITDSDAKLSFSLDTLRFDTVFTELGSATRSFKVYNRNDLPIKVSKVYLENGSQSLFRMNIDGLTGQEIQEIEIGAQDSIYVFAEVTIDPNDPLSISPFILEEFVTFETNGNVQNVLFEAWGQNANYVPSRFFQNGVGILSCDLQEIVWDDPKPYVVYGTLLIDSCELVLPPGTQVYVHGGVANNALGVYNDGIIFTLRNGKITSNGTVDQPVIIQDDRLEEEYIGVWGGIRIGPGSKGHSFQHTIIRHGIVGISVDSAGSLNLESSIIESCAGFGLFGRHASITAKNCLFADHGGDAVALTYGGDYAFDYCTVVSYGNDSEALSLNNFYCTDPLCLEEVYFNPLSAHFRNSIMVGSSPDEIALTDGNGEEGYFNYSMENCLVRIDELDNADSYPDFFEFCNPCTTVTFTDALFVSIDENDYHLDTLSIAEQLAIPIPGIAIDLEGNLRDLAQPDVGCYEYIYQ